MSDNTLLLRLAGPMQAWGTGSRFQLRRTDHYPSKSGVLGLLLCAMGVCRQATAQALGPLNLLSVGVRVDRAGALDWDYHTAGGGHGHGPDRASGIRSADGRVKRTASTGEYETLLSRREYLWDASFLVAIHGSPGTISRCAAALAEPAWPVFLGRKCCVPGEPVLIGTDVFGSVAGALSSIPWRPRVAAIDGNGSHRTLDCFLEHPPGTPPPKSARLVYDVPAGFGYYNHGPRFVTASQVTVSVDAPLYPPKAPAAWVDPYGPGWEEVRRQRKERDHGLCVFCKSPAEEVHHLDYGNVTVETTRSLCKLCHGACTMHEYGNDMRRYRFDPADSRQRPIMLQSIERLLQQRRANRRQELLEAGRTLGDGFYESPVG